MKSEKYDIFISYRRSSYESANLIATRLKAMGYSVFFDLEALRSGKFNEQLYTFIEQCTDFLVVLPEGALDRCHNEDDWVRLEVCHAMKWRKNIVPVMLKGFVWPTPMPRGMEGLEMYHSLAAGEAQYFDQAMRDLQERYLHSKRRFPIQLLMKKVGVLLFALIAIIVLLWGVFRLLSRDVCQQYATHLTNDASAIHLIAQANESLEREWERFRFEYPLARDKGHAEALQQDMQAQIDLAEETIRKGWRVDTVAMEIGGYSAFLLSLHGINAEEVAISPVFATTYYNDYLDQLEALRMAVADPQLLYVYFADKLFEQFEHSKNAYYATVLSELSLFPTSSKQTFYQLQPTWKSFPMAYEVDSSISYYERLINAEFEASEKAVNDINAMTTQTEAKLYELEAEYEAWSTQLEENAQAIQARQDSTAHILGQIALDAQRKANEQELAMHQERVDMKRASVAATKAELAEVDRKYLEAYDDLKERCRIEAEDDQWYQWGKIRRWGASIAMMVESRRKLQADGIYSTSAVTPDVAYADMHSMLSVYESYHPESASYVASTKAFFKALSRDKVAYGGVLIFAFQGDADHPVLREGDIVVRYNGQSITTYQDLKAAYKADNNAGATLLRLVGGTLEEVEVESLEPVAVVGFIELTDSILSE